MLWFLCHVWRGERARFRDSAGYGRLSPDSCELACAGKGLGWKWITQGTVRREAARVEGSKFVSRQAAALQAEGGKLLGHDLCSQVELLLRFFQALYAVACAFGTKGEEASQSVLLSVASLI